ncbi:MAG: hypothetical protein H6922_00040 [Pseudomonadaceae bacterium]|nr:hypothetical protein [Pseudomonadaceae bacterium]
MATKKTAKVPKTFTPRFIEEVDGRFGVAKELRRRYEALRADVGAEESAQRDMLARRAVFMGMCLETMEADGIETGHFDAGVYTQTLTPYWVAKSSRLSAG